MPNDEPFASRIYSVATRDRISDRLLALADEDTRIVAGAIVGSLALGGGDRWSDLDLTFAVADEVPIAPVLDDWTRVMLAEYSAAQLFDLQRERSIYRVFLLPGCLQVDLSFTPASSFGALGAKWRLLFGTAVPKPQLQSPPAGELFGYAVHHALRARFCVERGRYWQAEYWISSLRDYTLALACLSRGLNTSYGRGFDDLPADVRDAFGSTLVTSLERAELLRALASTVDGLLREGGDAQPLAAEVEAQLRMLTEP